MKQQWLATLTAACLLAGILSQDSALAQKDKKKTNVASTSETEAGPDFRVQGEYVGTSGREKAGMQVIARGDGMFDVNLLKGGLAGAGWDNKTKETGSAKTEDGRVTVTGKTFVAIIAGGKIAGAGEQGKLALEHVVRQSPTAGAKPPSGAVV